jgi:hypothetical protein
VSFGIIAQEFSKILFHAKLPEYTFNHFEAAGKISFII